MLGANMSVLQSYVSQYGDSREGMRLANSHTCSNSKNRRSGMVFIQDLIDEFTGIAILTLKKRNKKRSLPSFKALDMGCLNCPLSFLPLVSICLKFHLRF